MSLRGCHLYLFGNKQLYRSMLEGYTFLCSSNRIKIINSFNTILIKIQPRIIELKTEKKNIFNSKSCTEN